MEFAIIAPVLLVLLLAILYYAFYLSVAHSLAQLSADTARYAMVGLTEDERRSLANQWVATQNSAYGLVRHESLDVSISEAEGMLQVAVVYDMESLPKPPILGGLVPLPARLERATTVLVP